LRSHSRRRFGIVPTSILTSQHADTSPGQTTAKTIVQHILNSTDYIGNQGGAMGLI